MINSAHCFHHSGSWKLLSLVPRRDHRACLCGEFCWPPSCRIPSKFDLRRFCRATGATALVAVQAPTADELGFAKELTVEEV